MVFLVHTILVGFLHHSTMASNDSSIKCGYSRCNKTIPSSTRRSCKDCRAVFYCCSKHQRWHKDQHQEECNVLSISALAEMMDQEVAAAAAAVREMEEHDNALGGGAAAAPENVGGGGAAAAPENVGGNGGNKKKKKSVPPDMRCISLPEIGWDTLVRKRASPDAIMDAWQKRAAADPDNDDDGPDEAIAKEVMLLAVQELRKQFGSRRRRRQ